MSLEGEQVLAEKIDWQNRQMEKLHIELCALRAKLEAKENQLADARKEVHMLHAKLDKAIEDAANYEMDKHRAEARLAESEEKLLVCMRLLKNREWVEPNLGEGSEYNICLECGRADFDGHKSDCIFVATLTRLGAGGQGEGMKEPKKSRPRERCVCGHVRWVHLCSVSKTPKIYGECFTSIYSRCQCLKYKKKT